MNSLFARPSAYLPLLMSVVAFATVLLHLVLIGTAREADEGTAAHLFQLLIVGQLPVIGFFAIRWSRRASKPAAAVLASQFLAITVAVAPVWYFNL